MVDEVEAIKYKFDDPAWVKYWLGKPRSFGYAWELLFAKIFDEAGKLYPLPMEGKTALVIGCGPGAEAEWLMGRGCKVFCTDVNDDFLKLARRRLGKRAMGYLIANAEKLPFKDKSFDIVYMCGVLHHIPDYKKAIVECKRVAREGVIIINEPREPPVLSHIMKAVNWNTEYGDLDTHRFRGKEIIALLAEGGWATKKSTRWMYFPNSLKSLVNSRPFSRGWMVLMGALNLFLPFLGHQLNVVAWKR